MDYYWTVNIDKILKFLERLSPFWILYLHLNGWSRKIACLKIFKKYCNEKFCSFNVSTFCCSKNFSLLGFEPYSMRLNFKKCHFKFSKKKLSEKYGSNAKNEVLSAQWALWFILTPETRGLNPFIVNFLQH